MGFGKSKDDKWIVLGLPEDEQIVKVMYEEQIIRRPTLQSWPFYPVPYKADKELRKNPHYKDVKEYFRVLTNKRVIDIDYKTKLPIAHINLADCEIIAGTPERVNMGGEYRADFGELSFMQNNQIVWTIYVKDHLTLFQYMKQFQQSLRSGKSEITEQVQTQFTNSKPRDVAQNTPPPEQLEEDPLSILKVRFVKGEITKEEFEEMKELLE